MPVGSASSKFAVRLHRAVREEPETVYAERDIKYATYYLGRELTPQERNALCATIAKIRWTIVEKDWRSSLRRFEGMTVREKQKVLAVPIDHIVGNFYLGMEYYLRWKLKEPGTEKWRFLRGFCPDVIITLNHDVKGKPYPTLTERDVVHLNIPFIDTAQGFKPLLEHLPKIMQVVYPAIVEGKQIYFHCMAGMHRSPTALVLALVILTGLSFNEVFQYVQGQRPQVSPPLCIQSKGSPYSQKVQTTNLMWCAKEYCAKTRLGQ